MWGGAATRKQNLQKMLFKIFSKKFKFKPSQVTIFMSFLAGIGLNFYIFLATCKKPKKLNTEETY